MASVFSARRAIRNALVFAVAAATSIGLAGTGASTAPAAAAVPIPGGGDVLLASFFTSDADRTDTLYYSRDGKNFHYISTPYNNRQNPFVDPSLLSHNGYVWMLANWNRHDGKFWPMIGASPDGIHWSKPEGRQFNRGAYGGIVYAQPPRYGTDVVAPDWFKAPDGGIYIIFSVGHYGALHGHPEQDRMEPYIVKVNQLRVLGAGTPRGSQIVFVPGVAQRVNLNVPSDDRIDGSLYADGGTVYLNIKRDGQCNEIWSSGSVYGPWRRIQSCLARGNEGPNLVKYGNTYYLYTDRIAHWHGYRAPGVEVQTARSPYGPWSAPQSIKTFGRGGRAIPARQGSVIRYNSVGGLDFGSSGFGS